LRHLLQGQEELFVKPTARKTAQGALAAISFAMLLYAPPAAAGDTKQGAPPRDVSEALTAVSIRSTLVEKMGTEALRIRVSVSGETATLTGEVMTSASQELAQQVALSVRGVAKVENRVTQQNGDAASTASEASLKDVSLEMKVKAVLLEEFGAIALRIEVEAVDGAVSLRGKLDRPETGRAVAKRTRSIQGVRKVVDLLG
jgi:osmotically-inducible protein OsmY